MAKMIIGIAGEIGSGKGTVAKYIAEKYQGVSFSFSGIMRDILDRLHLEQSRKNLPKISIALRQAFGEDIFSKVMAEDIKDNKNEIIIVDAIRRLEDMKYLREVPGFKFFYVESEMNSRFERITKRKENVDDQNKTFKQFEEEHLDEPETTIKGLKQYADFIIENNGTLEDLYKQVDEIINNKN